MLFDEAADLLLRELQSVFEGLRAFRGEMDQSVS
jgi:hypothetical protein